MRQTAQQQVKGWIFYVIVCALAIGGVLIGVVLGGRGVSAAELQSKLIESCQTTRQPLQAYFEGEIAATEATSPSLFPDIPPEVFQRLIDEKVARLQALVDTFDPRSCAEQYE